MGLNKRTKKNRSGQSASEVEHEVKTDEEIKREADRRFRAFLPDLIEYASYLIGDIHNAFNSTYAYLAYTSEARSDRFQKVRKACFDLAELASDFCEDMQKSEVVEDENIIFIAYNKLMQIHNDLELVIYRQLSKVDLYSELCEDMMDILVVNEEMFTDVFGISFFYYDNNKKIYPKTSQKWYADIEITPVAAEEGVLLPNGYVTNCVHKGVWRETGEGKYTVLKPEIVQVVEANLANNILIHLHDPYRSAGRQF